MAISSTLTLADVRKLGLRVSNASTIDFEFYDRAAYRRLNQLNAGDADGEILTTLFPRATIELLTLLEFSWWPQYCEMVGIPENKTVDGQRVTAFDPNLLIKQNQSLIKLEIYKAVEILYSTLVTDNSNINTRDQANLEYAKTRFADEWNNLKTQSFFYDLNVDDVVSKDEENTEVDPAFYDSDRRYF